MGKGRKNRNDYGSNRTFMELKFDEVEEVKVWRVVLIAPLWN